MAAIFLAAAILSAQGISTQKTDKIIFLDGAVKEGKVISLATETVRFAYRGETLDYEFDKKAIEKIEFASGRTELITEKKLPAIRKHGDSRNKVAIMPISYISDAGDAKSEEMRFQLQEIAINYLGRSAAELTFLDAATLNAQLLKKSINETNARQYTPKELAELLQVEYVIIGSVQQDKGEMVTVTNSRNTRREAINHHHHYRAGITRKNTRTSSSVTRQHIETYVSLSVFNEDGEMIYTKSRRSILSESHAYKNAIEYLLKRTPLYKR